MGGSCPSPVRAAKNHVVVEGGNPGSIVEGSPLPVEVGVNELFAGGGVEGGSPWGKSTALCLGNEMGGMVSGAEGWINMPVVVLEFVACRGAVEADGIVVVGVDV